MWGQGSSSIGVHCSDLSNRRREAEENCALHCGRQSKLSSFDHINANRSETELDGWSCLSCWAGLLVLVADCGSDHDPSGSWATDLTILGLTTNHSRLSRQLGDVKSHALRNLLIRRGFRPFAAHKVAPNNYLAGTKDSTANPSPSLRSVSLDSLPTLICDEKRSQVSAPQ